MLTRCSSWSRHRLDVEYLVFKTLSMEVSSFALFQRSGEWLAAFLSPSTSCTGSLDVVAKQSQGRMIVLAPSPGNRTCRSGDCSLWKVFVLRVFATAMSPLSALSLTADPVVGRNMDRLLFLSLHFAQSARGVTSLNIVSIALVSSSTPTPFSNTPTLLPQIPRERDLPIATWLLPRRCNARSFGFSFGTRALGFITYASPTRRALERPSLATRVCEYRMRREAVCFTDTIAVCAGEVPYRLALQVVVIRLRDRVSRCGQDR
ncbi:hypothetical protein EXIGLDRAFT_832342 [Exidia glandulosa HHB12029]|uniref:Uncharacterized protein n=1 Tax=Exidia glandulosa HHB12029 TaxID=1314781 RepID=A0A165LSD8_EXIGL|nr:hypothetical protein EXIGLDRAFT_832342 [Exidia glandulosa HHB12029]